MEPGFPTLIGPSPALLLFPISQPISREVSDFFPKMNSLQMMLSNLKWLPVISDQILSKLFTFPEDQRCRDRRENWRYFIFWQLALGLLILRCVRLNFNYRYNSRYTGMASFADGHIASLAQLMWALLPIKKIKLWGSVTLTFGKCFWTYLISRKVRFVQVRTT